MELETLRLIAFAIATESREGVMAKSPSLLRLIWHTLSTKKTAESILAVVEEAFRHRLANYMRVWEVPFENERIELTPAGEQALAEAEAAPEKEVVAYTPADVGSVDAILAPPEKPKGKSPKKPAKGKAH